MLNLHLFALPTFPKISTKLQHVKIILEEKDVPSKLIHLTREITTDSRTRIRVNEELTHDINTRISQGIISA